MFGYFFMMNHFFYINILNLVWFYYKQIATLIAVYANWSFAAVEGIGWGWAGVIWLYNIIFYFPLDLIKFFIRYTLSGRAWDLVIERRVSVKITSSFHLIFKNLWNDRLSIYVCFLRLHSQDKRISGKNNVRCNGHTHKERFMGLKCPTQKCLVIERMWQILTRWQRKPNGEQRLQSTTEFPPLCQFQGFWRWNLCFLMRIAGVAYLLQVKRTPHVEGACRIGGENEGYQYRNDSTSVHCLTDSNISNNRLSLGASFPVHSNPI